MSRTVEELRSLVKRHENSVMFIRPMQNGRVCGTLLSRNADADLYEVDEYTQIEDVWACDMFCRSYTDAELDGIAADFPEVLTAQFQPTAALRFQ